MKHHPNVSLCSFGFSGLIQPKAVSIIGKCLYTITAYIHYEEFVEIILQCRTISYLLSLAAPFIPVFHLKFNRKWCSDSYSAVL